ncbi:retrovirus-related pol polyprotein from transposon TNT 1-94 [Tanacetum coccineum]
MILSGADNRPPMLDKDLYDSWKSRMELYMQNREHGRMILESIEHGPLIWPTVEENGVIRTKKYAELSAAKKFKLDSGKRVSQRLPPEWSKFVTNVKLVKDLHTSNFNQLHAYLEQHKLHANEVRIMRERNQDPLAFIANQQMTPPHFNTYQSSYNNPQHQQHFSPSQHASIQPNQHYSSHYPSQTQFNHSSIPPSHTLQSQMNHQISTVPQVLLFMDFLTAVASSRFPTTNNQLKTSSNPRNQSLFKNGRVTGNKFREDKGKITLVKDIWLGNALSQRDQGMQQVIAKKGKIHIDYLRNTQEQANILWEIVKQVKAKQPLDGDLDLACKYATRIQELLVYVQDTCPNAITPMIVDDYSRFTWVRFLKTKDEAPAAIIKCIKNIQVRLKATVRNVRTDNGTEFVNQTLREWYENVGISHQTSVARTPQQNGVVERRNRTLVEAARTMLIFSKAPLFLWAEAINTACYTQNRSLIRLRYNKTPYELMQDKKPDLSFFHVFGSLCYPTNDHEDLGKFDAKADIGIFIGYAPAKKAFRIYNRRTRIITEIIHVTFNELSAMASE